MEIEYKKCAVKYIDACDKKTKKRLKEAIENIPLGDIRKLKGYEQEYRLRVEDIRVLFTYENGVVTVNAIKPRGEIYKRI